MHSNRNYSRAYSKGADAAKQDLGLHAVQAPPHWTQDLKTKVTVPSALGRDARPQEKKAFLGHDYLHGGPADKKKPSDFNPKELRKGQKHEMEHTDSPALAKEIASDHLVEMPDYYERILKLEKK